MITANQAKKRTEESRENFCNKVEQDIEHVERYVKGASGEGYYGVEIKISEFITRADLSVLEGKLEDLGYKVDRTITSKGDTTILVKWENC